MIALRLFGRRLLWAAVLMCSMPASGGEEDWFSRFTEVEFPTQGTGLSVWPHDQGVYVSGRVYPMRDFDQALAWVANYDLSGGLVWSKELDVGPVGNDDVDGRSLIYDLKTSPDDDLYAIGYTNRSLYGPVGSDQEMLLMRLRPDGDVVWGKQIPMAGRVVGSALEWVGENQLLAAGSVSTYRSHTYGDVLGQADAFLALFDQDGQIQWQRVYETPHNELVTDAAVDSLGNIYTLAAKSEDVVGVLDVYDDVVLRKFSPAGLPLWSRTLDSGGLEAALELVIDSEDKIYLAGYTNGSLDNVTDTGNRNAPFLAQFDSQGALGFIQQYVDEFSAGITSIALADSGELYLVGSIIVGPYTPGYEENYADLLIYRVALDGALIESYQMDSSNYERVFDLALSEDGGVYLTGFSQYSQDGVLTTLPYVARFVVPEPSSLLCLGIFSAWCISRRDKAGVSYS